MIKLKKYEFFCKVTIFFSFTYAKVPKFRYGNFGTLCCLKLLCLSAITYGGREP